MTYGYVMRRALFFMATTGVALMFPLGVAVWADKSDPLLELGLATLGALLLAPGAVWLVWRAFWAGYGQTVKEARRAHRKPSSARRA